MCILYRQHPAAAANCLPHLWLVLQDDPDCMLNPGCCLRRTLDPEEADFFYVPLYTSCYMWPIHGWVRAASALLNGE